MLKQNHAMLNGEVRWIRFEAVQQARRDSLSGYPHPVSAAYHPEMGHCVVTGNDFGLPWQDIVSFKNGIKL